MQTAMYQRKHVGCNCLLLGLKCGCFIHGDVILSAYCAFF